MALLANIYIKAETLKTLADTIAKKGEKGLSLTISVNDETNQYGQNISSYVSQSKEEREAKKDKFYVANGAVVWTDGKVVKADALKSKQVVEHIEKESDSLPF